jgi:hypothetical protein
MSNTIKEHDEKRKDLWIKAWCATANANDCKHTSTATRYADEALKAFDDRFPKPTITKDA